MNHSVPAEPSEPGEAEDAPVVPEADTKDWTWATEHVCADCGFDPAGLSRQDIPAVLLDSSARWRQVLAAPGVRSRPSPAVWSPLEYGCHCRDVYLLFAQRAASVLEETNPVFANWDQDATAVQQRYWRADPDVVAREIDAAARASADVFAGVRDDEWSRPGTRSNGSTFTVESLGRYFVHDIVHHLHDVGARGAIESS